MEHSYNNDDILMDYVENMEQTLGEGDSDDDEPLEPESHLGQGQRPVLGPTEKRREAMMSFALIDIDANEANDSLSGSPQNHLQAQLAFPFALNKAVKVVPQDTGRKLRHKTFAKGARGGKLAPGEKARLRQEKIEAKRASREAGRGFDVELVAEELIEFAEACEEGDMMDLMETKKHGLELSVKVLPPPVMSPDPPEPSPSKMARMLGLRASVQGGGWGGHRGSSGTRVIVSVPTDSNWLAPSSKAINSVLGTVQIEIERQRKGAVFGGPLGSGMSKDDTGAVRRPYEGPPTLAETRREKVSEDAYRR